MSSLSSNTIRFRRPAQTTNRQQSTIFPPTIYTNATYSRGILLPNTNSAVVDGHGIEDVTISVPYDYFTSSKHSSRLPSLTDAEAIHWNHNIAAHASAKRRPPFEIGRLLGTISLRFRDGTTEKGESLYTLAKRYYGKYPVSGRKVGKKEGDKFKLLTLKQALVEAMTEAGIEADFNSLSAEQKSALTARSQRIFDYWKRIRDSPALQECWQKRHGGFVPAALGNVMKGENEFYAPIEVLMEWLENDKIIDLHADRVKSLYGGLRLVETDAASILKSLEDLSCPATLYKIPLLTPVAMAKRATENGSVTWEVRIGVFMNRLLPEVLTENNLHCIMSALDEDSYIISQQLHLPPMRDPKDPVFASAKYPIVLAPEIIEDDPMDEDKKEEEDADIAFVGSTRETKTISPFTPRGLLKLLENTGNVTTDFPEIAKALAPYLKLDLMEHQKHAVCWMKSMENLGGFGINSIIWEEREFLDGNKYYYSPALGQIRLNRPPTTAGGCVADEMGLGKTIQMLSLISCSLEELKAEARADQSQHRTHATLIIVPPALVAQWVAEVNKCCGKSLSVDVLDASNINAGSFPRRDLIKAGGNGNDILVTTYSALDNIKTSKYLAGWSWGRIVLDEQQEIRSSTTKIAKNCESLVCHRRWMLSGTPIFEGIDDLRGELNFLRLSPYAAQWEDGFFDFSIMNHWKHHSEHGIATLRILGLLILRRSKDMSICRTGLPIMDQKKLTVELVPVAQSDSERALYCWFEYIVSQEISRKVREDNKAKHNLQSRDLCLRLLREVCFSAVLINGGLGAGSQMRSLNAMYRRLLLRGKDESDATSPSKTKKPGTIKKLSPIQALTYLNQVERAANVGDEFISEQTFAGGQGASSRTYAVDSIEVQIEKAQMNVDNACKKEAEARRRRAKAYWHLALELITTGSLSKNKREMERVSINISSLWKWRCNSKEDARGWRPTATFIQSIQEKFPWANPNALQLINIPSQVTVDEVSTALFNALSAERKIVSKLNVLRNNHAKAKTKDVIDRIQEEILDANAKLPQAIANDKKMQKPIVSAVKTSADDWIAFVRVSNKKVHEELMRMARSRTGIALNCKETAPHIQSAIDQAAEKLKQAEAAYNVHPSAKNKEKKTDGKKRLDEARAGLRIIADSSVLSSVKLHVTMSIAMRTRGGLVHKSKSHLFESTTASIALANETLAMIIPRLKDDQSNLDRLMSVLEKKTDRSDYLSQKSAFDTLEALRTKKFDDTFCPICQLTFGENAGDEPHIENPLAAMISCGHFFCIKCLEQHIQNEISRFHALTCPCCRKGFNQHNDVIHIDHLATDHDEIAMERADAKKKVVEASELMESSDGILEGELWRALFLSIDLPTHVSNAPHRHHTALPQDVLAHFRAATGMMIDCSRSDTPVSWAGKESKGDSYYSGISSKIQTLLRDLPLGERSVVFSSSKEGVLHLTSVIKACGIDCFSLYVGSADASATELWGAVELDEKIPGPVLVIQAGAAASGLTLTAASKIFLMEPFNRQEEEQQAYARCHRYGQTKNVHVKVYYAPVSVESRLLRWRKRSAEKFAAASNGPNYVFTELYEDSGDEEGDDGTVDNSVSLGEKDGDEETDGEKKEESDEVHEEENLRTQFLLGLVDEHGNPIGEETQVNQRVEERPVTGRRFILG